MTYLDERIIAKFSSLPYPDEGIYQYTVYVGEEYIFIGNKFLFTAESDTTIDITDLVRNYFYDHFDYSYSEYEVYVHLQIGTTTAVSQILQIVPVYRYPNYAATDLYFDGTKNTIMLSGNLDNSFTAYNIPDSLLPTYPKVTTANINIDYYIANVTDDNYVIDYGPIVQISQEQPQSFYHITGDLTPTTTTDSLWYTGISEFAANQLATIGNSIIYSTKTTSQPTILYITTAAGLTKQRTIDSFPYSYSESTSGNYDNQCPISFAVATADETLIASNVTVTGNISTTINVSIKQTGTNYNIFITQSGERTIEQDFADQILLYDPDTRFATTDLADVNYSLSVSGDLTLSSTTTIKPTYTMQGNFAFYILESGVVKYAAQYGMQSFPNLYLPNTTILVYYYNAERGLCSGFIHITVDNPLANFANYTAWSITNVIDLGGITFQHRTDQAATIGYLTPRCNSKYFVIWWDRFGSRQCQPFDRVDTYSEDLTANEFTNYWGKRFIYSVDLQPKWKLQTGWISDAEYRCFESLFICPTVQIYDTVSDHLYDVIIKDRSYTEKTFQNQGKLFNIELTFEAAEKQNIIY